MFYFSYDENMDQATMALHCENAVPAGRAVLEGFKFVMNSDGFASITPARGHQVMGVLWQVDDFAELSLNKAMGVPAGKAGKLPLKVRTSRNRKVTALVYLPGNTVPALCGGYALNRILEGARDFKLPSNYIEYLRSWSSDFVQPVVHAA